MSKRDAMLTPSLMDDAVIAERIRYLKHMQQRGVITWYERELLDGLLREQAERDYKKDGVTK